MMSSSGGQQQHSLSKSVSLSRSVVLTQDTSIPSMLILGKLLKCTVSGSDGTTATTTASLRAMLLQDWAPSGAVNFLRVTDGAFLVQFHEEADLRRAMDGAPWSCDGGHHLFLMQQAKPETNLVDQLVPGTGFTFATADLWVQFHNVPVEYFSAATLSALAARVGVPLVLPDLGVAPVELLRARIRVDITRPLVRSLQVDLDDDGRSELVSVVYEQIPILCAACGIVGHPLDRCPTGAAAAAASRSRRERPAAPSSTTGSLRGSRRSSAMKEPQPQPDAEKNDQHSGRSSASPTASSSLPPDDACPATSSRSRREKPSGGYVPSRLGSRTESSREHQQPLLGTVENDDEDPSAPSSRTSSSTSTAGGERLLVLGTPERRHTHNNAVSVNGCLPFNSILKLVSRTKKKEPVGEIKAADGGGVNLQDAQRTSQKQQTLLLTFSAQQNVQESLVTEGKETPTTTCLAVRTPSTFQLNGGYVSYYSRSESRKNPRIEVRVETQCSAQLMKKAMEWLAENTGLRASYDGKKGVISIVGLQVDQRMGPVDIVASLYPSPRNNSGVDATETRGSPARFEDTIIRLHDEITCLSKGAPSSRDTAKNGLSR